MNLCNYEATRLFKIPTVKSIQLSIILKVCKNHRDGQDYHLPFHDHSEACGPND